MLKHHNEAPTSPRRVVVLGETGFLAHKLRDRLAAEKVETLSLGRTRLDLAAPDATGKLAAELHDGDALVFLSALTPDKGRGIDAFMANLRMGEAVCGSLKGRNLAQIVYISSDAVYPFRQGLVDESSCAEPTDLYGTMHLARELMLKSAGAGPVAVLRPTLVYGATDTHNSYGPNRLRRMAQKSGKITLFGGGEETRDHIYVDDVVALIWLAMQRRSEGTLNLATGRSISYADLAKLVAAHFKTPVEIEPTERKNEITHRAFNPAALHRAFPEFRFTPLEEGLRTSHREEFGG